MKLRRLIQIQDRKMAAYERSAARKINDALHKQIRHYIKNGFIDNSIENALREIYRPISIYFFEQQYKILERNNINKKDRFFIDAWDSWLNDFLVQRSIERSFLIDQTTKAWIQNIEAAYRRGVVEGITGGAIGGETIGSLTEYIETFTGEVTKRARTIARTEVGEAVNESKTKASDEWGNDNDIEQGKIWIHRGAKHPRDWHLKLDDNKIIPKNSYWVVTSPSGQTDNMRYPHDPNASAINTVNCGCLVIYTRLDMEM